MVPPVESANARLVPQMWPSPGEGWRVALHPAFSEVPKMASAFEELAPKASAAAPSAIVSSVFLSINPSPDEKLPTTG
jgi:hypothetical protein